MELFLDHACNLRCRYCYNGRHPRRPLPPEVMSRAIDLAFTQGSGPVDVLFFGGEPLLAFELMRAGVTLAREASAGTGRPARFQVTTNGTLLDGPRLDLLAAEGFRVAVSLDGPADVHDPARSFANGRGSHARVVANLLAARPVLRNLAVAAVLTGANLHRARDLVDFPASLGIRDVHLSIDWHAAWSPADLRRLRPALHRIGDAYADEFRRGRPLTLPMFDSKIARHVLQPLVGFGRCKCGDSEWTVAPSGRIYPCDRMVGEDDGAGPVIGDVCRGIDPDARARFLACHQGTPARCSRCPDGARCSFWASCVRHALTGRADALPPAILCRVERAILAAADRAAGALFAERDAAFLRRFYQGPLARRALEGLGLEPEPLLAD